MYIIGKRLSFLILVLLTASLLSFCDGGTRGTGVGNGRAVVKGHIEVSNELLRTKDLSPIEGMIVVAESYRDGTLLDSSSDVSDERGDFELTFEEVDRLIIFRFSTEGWDGEILLDDIPEDLETALLEFEVIDRKVSLSSVKYQSRPSATPHPGGTLPGGSSPTPNAGPSSEKTVSPGSALPTPSESNTIVPSTPGKVPTPEPTFNETPLPTNTPTFTPSIDDNTGNPDPESTPTPTATPQLPQSPPSTIIICHKSGKKNQTLEISQNALNAHLAHGDTLGACP